MDFNNLIDAIIPYGLPSLIVAVAAAAACVFANGILYKLKAKEINSALPFSAAAVACFITLTVLYKTDVFAEETLSASLLSGSVAASVFVFIKNLKNKTIGDAAYLFKSVISRYTDKENAKKIGKELKSLYSSVKNEEEFISRAREILKNCGIDEKSCGDAIEKFLKENKKDGD